MVNSAFWLRVVSPSIFVVLVISATARGQMVANAEPFPARKFTFGPKNSTVREVIAELIKQTGLEVDITGIDANKQVTTAFQKSDFWTVIESLAVQTDSRVVVGQRGKFVRLVKFENGVRPPMSIDGPFRIAAKEVQASIDLETGKSVYDLTLEIAWEARLPVFRVDAQPRISKGLDDSGRAVGVKPIDSRTPTAGAVTMARIRLEGLTRLSKRIATLQGTFQVTAAEEMLRFDFVDLTKPVTRKQKDVAVVLKRFAKDGSFWIADIELKYPPGGAVFESFETYWVGRNRLTLIAPDGTTRFVAADEEINGSAIRYRFKEDKAKGLAPANLMGWTMEYETPGIIREIPVKFELSGIALP